MIWKYIDVLSSGNTAETRGTAFVVYEDIFDAKNACDHLSGFNVCNRYLVVLYYQAVKVSNNRFSTFFIKFSYFGRNILLDFKTIIPCNWHLHNCAHTRTFLIEFLIINGKIFVFFVFFVCVVIIKLYIYVHISIVIQFDNVLVTCLLPKRKFENEQKLMLKYSSPPLIHVQTNVWKYLLTLHWFLGLLNLICQGINYLPLGLLLMHKMWNK